MKKKMNIQTSIYILLFVCIVSTSLRYISPDWPEWISLIACGVWLIYYLSTWLIPKLSIKVRTGFEWVRQAISRGTQKKDEKTTDAGLLAELQKTRSELYNQVAGRITDALSQVYPNSKWAWANVPAESYFLVGGTQRIRLEGVPDYQEADVVLGPNGELIIYFVQTDTLGEVLLQKQGQEAAERWLADGRILGAIIDQARQQGQHTICISQYGEVYTGTEDIPMNRVAPLPPQHHLKALADRISGYFHVHVNVQNDRIYLNW